MQRHVVIVVTAVLLVAGVGSAALVAHAANSSSEPKASHQANARQFVGYWMGIDPLDGGDSRRGITINTNRTFSVIGRDTVFTLCDGTDRAIVTAGDAVVVGSALVSDNLVITCTNTGSNVKLKVRYDAIDRNIIRETVTRQSGEPVDEIIFHRVSER
jgi:acetaldehyde dehydrogenase (acetylating)